MNVVPRGFAVVGSRRRHAPVWNSSGDPGLLSRQGETRVARVSHLIEGGPDANRPNLLAVGAGKLMAGGLDGIDSAGRVSKQRF